VAGDWGSRTGARHRTACRVVTAPPLHLRRRAKDTGAAAGGDRDRLVAGGNSGDFDLRLPGGRVVARDMSGRGGESGRAVTTCFAMLSQSRGVQTYKNIHDATQSAIFKARSNNINSSKK